MISSAVRIFVLVVFVLVTAASKAAAQSSCPNVSVSCIGTIVVGTHCEPPFFFRAMIANPDPNQKISYEWEVTNGRIVEGQGTPVIKVVGDRVTKTVNRDGKLVTEVWDNRNITAVVKLIGAPAECKGTTASMSFVDERGMVLPPVVVEEFGSLAADELKWRLDSFANHLRNQPGATGYIISEGNWRRANRAMGYLVNTKGIDKGRITYVAKSRTKRFNVKLYVVPAGSVPPR